jgi:4-hydroxy-3-methylbut-2-enyl diphosphate reductase
MNSDFKSPLNKIPSSKTNFNNTSATNISKKQTNDLKHNLNLNIILTAPRGFCAGVRRAVEIVERAIEKYKTPIYVKHEIVHNKFVVEYFQKKGVIFVDDEKKVPKDSLIIYSAHGVSEDVETNSKNINLKTIDATCPLVKKVHREVIAYDQDEIEIILIGHKNHPEMLGTSGRIISKNFSIIETIEDAKNFTPKDPTKLAIATQTTLSINQTQSIVDYLTTKFPSIIESQRLKNDICYATENRQKAVKNILENNKIDILFVIGSTNSSNSNRLADIGREFNIKSFLLEKFDENIESFINNLIKTNPSKTNFNIAISAGASAPEILVQDFINKISTFFTNTNIEQNELIKEDTHFLLPKDVR